MSHLAKQKGSLKCSRRTCWDDLEVERRDIEIERILSTGVDQEGADMRVVDRGFFEGHEEGSI